MYFYAAISLFLIGRINCDCLYPEWKKTCQQYCMDHQLYEIQLNQCYSMNPNQLKCKCAGTDLTEKIKSLIQGNSSTSTSLTATQSVSQNSEQCIPSASCATDRIVCYGTDAYCACDNGTWEHIPCPKGNMCKAEDTTASCQIQSLHEDKMSKLHFFNVAVSIDVYEYLYLLVFYLLVKQQSDHV